MSRVDRSLEPLLAYWIAQQKDAERQREKALEDGKLWFRRAKLALDAGKPDMAAEAKGHALDARDRHERARLRLDIIAAERDILRSSRGNISEAAIRARERREHAMAEFQRLGIDPGFPIEAPDPLTATSEEDVLARLHERMALDRAGPQAPPTHAPTAAPPGAVGVDPLPASPERAGGESPPVVPAYGASAPPAPARRFETIGDATETED